MKRNSNQQKRRNRLAARLAVTILVTGLCQQLAPAQSIAGTPSGTGYAVVEVNGRKTLMTNYGDNVWGPVGQGRRVDELPAGEEPLKVAVDASGAPWVVTKSGRIFAYVSIDKVKPMPQWRQQPGTANDITAGQDGSLWAVGHDGGIYKWNGTAWMPMQASAPGAVAVSVPKSGLPSVLNANSGVLTFDVFTPGWWAAKSGTARQLAASSNSIFIVGTTSISDPRTNTSGYPVLIADGGAGFRQLTTTQGAPVLAQAISVDSSDRLWFITAASGKASTFRVEPLSSFR